MRLRALILLLLGMISGLSAGQAFAGGPFMVDDATRSGVPSRWPFENGKWVVRWKADPGSLSGTIDNAKGIENWVKPLFEKWKSVTLPDPKHPGEFLATTALNFVYDGTVNLDITAENYDDFIYETIDPSLQPETVVVFDVDGSLIEKFCRDQGNSAEVCKSHRKGVAGLAAPLNRDSSTKQIQNGFMIVNGSLVNGISNANDAEMNADQFKSVILHEMGHLLNLSHSQVNLELSERCDTFDCPTGSSVATMYPASLTHDQFTLHRDDKTAISHLYPTNAFQEHYCTVVGDIVDAKGKGMQGVNVFAQNVVDPGVDTRSGVSGIFFPPATENGQYVLAGLMPENNYEIRYEELTHEYDTGGGFMPLGPASPTGLGSGIVADASGNSVVRCDSGGKVIRLPKFALNVTTDPGEIKKKLDEAESAGEPASKKKGWFCALKPSLGPGSPGPVSFGGFLWLLFLPVLFYKRFS